MCCGLGLEWHLSKVMCPWLQAVLASLVTELRGASPSLRIIITSRTNLLAPAGMGLCHLEALPVQDAVQLLRQACPNCLLSDEQAAQVAEACRRNALELRLVGGVLNRGGITAQVRMDCGVCTLLGRPLLFVQHHPAGKWHQTMPLTPAAAGGD